MQNVNALQHCNTFRSIRLLLRMWDGGKVFNFFVLLSNLDRARGKLFAFVIFPRSFPFKKLFGDEKETKLRKKV
jgi:hypothetical protein